MHAYKNDTQVYYSLLFDLANTIWFIIKNFLVYNYQIALEELIKYQESLNMKEVAHFMRNNHLTNSR